MSSISDADLASFLQSLEAADDNAARSLAASVIAESEGGVAAVLDELIPQAMHRVGQLWESGEWTIAQEHAATEVCEGIVETVALESAGTHPNGPTVLVVCAEGEWHSLASRTVGVALQLHGWQPRLLGPSVSSSQLAASIFDSGPEFVAMTCSMVANLPGALRMIAAARETRTPILVGGIAFGDAPDRAERLGADGWAQRTDSVADFLGQVHSLESPEEVLGHQPEAKLLDSMSGSINMELSKRLGIEYALEGELAAGGVWMKRTLHAALLCDDQSLLTEHIRWHEGRTRIAGGLPSAVVIRALLGALPEEATTSRRWLEESAVDAGIQL